MFKSIREAIVMPLAVRVGTFGAGVLLTLGVTAENAATAGTVIETVISALFLIGCDLLMSQLRKRQIIRDALK